MNEETKDQIATTIVGTICVVMIALIFFLPIMCIVRCDNMNSTDRLMNEAVERGFAEYNRTNGRWEWVGEARARTNR